MHEPAAMSIADIFEALEGPSFIDHLSGNEPAISHATKPELLLGDVWDQVQQAERKVLEGITIEHLAMRQRTIDAQRTPMYHI